MANADLKVKIREITPEQAEEMLATNTHNRSPRMNIVSRYAGAMKRGEWEMNGEAIKIDKNGRLIDGQHRIMAILEAGIPVTMLVIEGLEPEAQETMDLGRSRTLGDILRLRGESNSTSLAAVLRTVLAFYKTGVPYAGGANAPTPQECIAFFEKNEDIVQSNQLTIGKANQIRWIPATFISALHFILTAVDEDDANAFIEGLVTGHDLPKGSPIATVRDRLIRESTIGRPLPQKVRAALVIKAWNAWRRGEEPTKLQFKAGGSKPSRFPEIDGIDYSRINLQQPKNAIDDEETQ